MAIIAVMKDFDSIDSTDNGIQLCISFHCLSGGWKWLGYCCSSIPDGTTLAQSRTIIAADIRACALAEWGVTVPANRVYLLDFVTA